ncbi:MAG: DUF2911 domain-containing protein [Bacteroidota bacterium]
MIKISNFYLLVGLLFSMACTGNVENTAYEKPLNTSGNSNTVMKGPLPAPEVATANYETVVLKGNIPSPQKRTSGQIAGANISITYGSPSVRGRKIWGGLEPYNEIWRMGANEATVFETDAAIQVEGQELAAGKYALFTIPRAKQDWTLIFNKAYDQWGAFEYDTEQDVLRAEITPVSLKEKQEMLSFLMDGSSVLMRWSDVQLQFEMNHSALNE